MKMNKIPFFQLVLTLGIFFANVLHVYSVQIVQHDEYVVEQSGDNNPFAGWTEEQYKHYEDSVLAALYPPVVAKKLEHMPDRKPLAKAAASYAAPFNSYVPTTVNVDRSKEVGEIPITSGTTPAGGKTYDIPIQVYPGIQNFTPNISLTYNSQQGSSTLGMGWQISGISMINRGGKTIYYDNKTEGVKFDNDDSFTLNGVRLIKVNVTSDYILYESEQGNIKAKGYFLGAIMKYFEVFYPDGNKGIFGYMSNNINQLFYPIVSLTDLHGNSINFEYIFASNHYVISKISYNGCAVEFRYSDNRNDPITSYSGGRKVYEPRLLQSITSKHGGNIINTYTLNYTTEKNKNLLTKVDLSAGGKYYNPISFYYGEGLSATYYNTSATQLMEWYESENPSMIKTVKGKFDYFSNSDGLIVLPNKNPYWKHHRSSTVFRHSQNRFDNLYSGDEKIFLYTGLNSNYALPMPNLTTEPGFVDIICGDLEGKQEECVVKINNTVSNGNDLITFKVYKSNLFTGLQRLYTRTYSFPTVYTDADGGKSVQPKYYYMGDFNGDGKMEVLAVSVHQPFGDTGKPSKCYIFDLVNDKMMYASAVFSYKLDYLGTNQSNPEVVHNNSDKLLVMDYDGDGKTDICHIDDTGVNIYTFEASGSQITAARKVASFDGLKKNGLADRELLVGEFNEDGLMDLLVSPTSKSETDVTWTVYNSTGNGLFEKSTFSGVRNFGGNDSGVLLQDVNGDGMTDLISFFSLGFRTYLASNNKLDDMTCYTGFPSNGSLIVPTNINSSNTFTQLISLKQGTATKYSFTVDYRKDMLLTGVASSLGVVEKNKYLKANEEAMLGGGFAQGDGAVFPFVNLSEPFVLLAASEKYFNGESLERTTYRYVNAVAHKQGLGFCGFEQIISIDNKDRASTTTYDPLKRGIVTNISTPTLKGEYKYSFTVQPNRITKLLLTQKTETDLLKNTTVSSSYGYDAFGYPNNEFTVIDGSIVVRKYSTYSHSSTVKDGYNLGFLYDNKVQTVLNGVSYIEREYIPTFSNRLPVSKIYSKNDNIVKEQNFAYDSRGNVLETREKFFSSPTIQTTKYEYDGYGRVVRKTDPMGLVAEFTYNGQGLLATAKDIRGGVTHYSYDAFGRESSVDYPDGSNKTEQSFWSTNGTNTLYGTTQEVTGQPRSTTYFDALGRKTREESRLVDGTIRYVDNIYDRYGRLVNVSLPFEEGASPKWNTYSYDENDRMISSTDAAGAVVKYEYNGKSITTISKNISQTKTYNALGNLVSVTDPGGTTNYRIAADGNPLTINAPGNVTTTFEYDNYRRRTKLEDPSLGTITYEYDDAGNLSKETDANGKVKQYEYDAQNRLIKESCEEFTTTYRYNATNDLVEISTNNGTGKTFVYDVFGRLAQWKATAPNNIWLQKTFTYENGNVSSIMYSSQAGVLAKENYVYMNGLLQGVRLNDTEHIYNISHLNALGYVSEIISGNITRKYDYTSEGLLRARSARSVNKNYQDFSYVFDANTSNLLSRKDNIRNITESFGYDELNRLTQFGGKSTGYDNRGNITNLSDIGSFEYNISTKPYAVSGVTLNSNSIPQRYQEIDYTSFSRPQSIAENGYVAEFTYSVDEERVKMLVSHNGSNMYTRYYLGDCYELEMSPNGNKERLYLGGDYYTATAVLVKENGAVKVYNILRDYLGSITHIIDADGNVVQELSYDAWGRLRNPATQQVYEPGEEPELFMGRGYTGHEHLTQFGLINMNARLYDAALGRFLSPDPYVQMPDFSQSFNRYSYCMNNPLCYVDLTGEGWIEVGAFIAFWYLYNAHKHTPEEDQKNPLKWVWNPIKWFEKESPSTMITVGMTTDGSNNYTGVSFGDSDMPMLGINFDNKKGNGIGFVFPNGDGRYYYPKYNYSKPEENAAKAYDDYVRQWKQTINVIGEVSSVFSEGANLMGEYDGSYRLRNSVGKWDPKYYSNGWKGNQWVKTKSLANFANKAQYTGRVLGFLSMSISAYNFDTAENIEMKIESGLDIVMGGIGLTPYGNVFSLYWTFGGKRLHQIYLHSVFYPQYRSGLNPGLPAYAPFK